MSIPGSNIRALRQQLNISLKTLADAVGMDKGGLSKLERGEHGYSRDTIEKIARILGVSVGVLFDEPDAVAAAVVKMRRVPVLTPAMLLVWKGPDGDEEPESTELLFASVERMSRHSFALRVPEKDGWPGYRTEDDLLFDARGNARHGCVVACQTSAGEVFVGRLRVLSGTQDFEVWADGMADPVACSARIKGLTIRGVLAEERRYSR